MKNNIIIRFAKKKDISTIFNFIKELAAYEKMLDQVIATEDSLKYWIFKKKKAEVLICEVDKKPAGFALFFHNFSTFVGRPGIYLEDIYIIPEMRGKGLGKKLLSYIAGLVKERNYGRMEWWCLDWNEKSINFYKNMGAVPMSEWTVYRMYGEKLGQLAEKE